MANLARVRFNEIFRPVNFCRKRYRVLKGSAGSGKSVDVAQDYIVKLMDKSNAGANLLVVRKIYETHRDSTYVELIGAIHRICGDLAPLFWKITQNPLRLECRTTGNSVIFRGMKDADQREKVKSVTFAKGKLTWIWCEEATELEQSDVDILDDRLRGELINPNLFYQITLTFNPVARTHWIKRVFFDIVDSDVFTHHSTYRDNAFIDAAYYRRMERRRIQDPDGYKVYGLGEWGETGGSILKNWAVEEFDTDFAYFDSMVHSQDFGFNHANAILTVGFKDAAATGGDLFVCNEIYVYEKQTAEVINLANKKKLDKRLTMWCDSAEPDRIKTWRGEGYEARPVHKDPGSVGAQIDSLQRMKIHIHPRCTNTIKEVGQWRWKKDPKTGLFLDAPVEFMDDAMACLRYSIEEVRRGRNESWTTHADY